ncbi:MAG: hypothetical protein J7577_13410 [Sphingobacteriaceae bacterium]|nr:hypothetical protein [Sphingobacteriaceae bacterium]
MSTLETVTNKAKALYPTKGKKIKTALEEVFGKQTFLAKITDRVKTVEDAYKELNLNRSDYIPTKSIAMTDKYYAQICAEIDFEIVVAALNEGVELSFANANQKKWRIWLKHDGISGFGFHNTFYDYADTLTNVGSRQSFATQELAEYAGTQFIELINKIANK